MTTGKQLILAAMLTAVCLPAADDLTRLIPPGTFQIVGIDAGRLRSTPRWPLLLDLAHRLRPFDSRTEATGFDPALHLDELMLLRVRGEHAGDLVILRGQFDASRLAGFDSANDARNEVRYRGIRVCTPDPGGLAGGGSIEFAQPYVQWTALVAGLVVIGPAETVRQALDTYVNAADSRPAGPAWFEPGIKRARGYYDTWSVGRLSSLSNLEFWAGMRLDVKPSAEAEVVAASPEAAQELFGTLCEALSVESLRTAGHAAKLAAESIRISLDRQTIRVTGESDWEPLLVLTLSFSRQCAQSPSLCLANLPAVEIASRY